MKIHNKAHSVTWTFINGLDLDICLTHTHTHKYHERVDLINVGTKVNMVTMSPTKKSQV